MECRDWMRNPEIYRLRQPALVLSRVLHACEKKRKKKNFQKGKNIGMEDIDYTICDKWTKLALSLADTGVNTR